jgi:hypothetical protein
LSNSPGTSTATDYEEQFLNILNNANKYNSDLASRERGFVVLVRGSSSLAGLQNLCFDKRQDYNHCFTARYRLKPPGIFGTVLVSFLSDLKKIFAEESGVKGSLMPDPSESAWRDLAFRSLNFMIGGHIWPANQKPLLLLSAALIEMGKRYGPEMVRDVVNIALESRGDLTPQQLKGIIDCFSDHPERDYRGLDPGDRLVLFAEVSEEAASRDEWNAAKETLFNRLPERMGLVISGAPADFKLTDDPADLHFLDLRLREGEVSAATTRSVVKFLNASFHRDQPASKDELDVNDYANALARFILHKQTLPPLTVGIHGRWGKGKSSFMKMVDNALVKHADINIQRPKIWRWQPMRAIPPELASNPLTRFVRRLDAVQTEKPARTEKWNDLVVELIKAEPGIQKLLGENEPTQKKAKAERQQQIDDFKDRQKRVERLWREMLRKGQQNVVSVWFNAWQFEDAKQTWAGLASQISERMESALPWYSRLWLRIRYSVKERKTELVLNVLVPLAVVLIVAALVWLGPLAPYRPKSDSELGRLLSLLLPGSGLLAIWFASTQFLKVTQPVSERVLTYVRLPNYREQMGFQHQVKDDLRFVHKFLCKRRKSCRVVVYIDDLDRCSEGKIMELLQAINLILASCEFFVFVGMDTEMIYRAIGSHYKENVPERFAENYLRKIIQISFYLPETKPEDRLPYVSSLFSWQARAAITQPPPTVEPGAPPTPIPTAPPAAGTLAYDLDRVLDLISIQYEDVEDTAEELRALHDYVQFLDDNPREIKRLVNLHRLVKILLQKANTDWQPPRQRKLVKWLVFCDAWPQLVDDIFDRQKRESADCLRDLTEELKRHADRNRKSLPYLAKLQRFIDLKAEDTLSNADIDDDFQRAAYLSQMIRDSPEVSPLREGDRNGYATSFLF